MMIEKKSLPYLLVATIGLAITFLVIRGRFAFSTATFLAFFLIFIPTIIKPNIGLALMIISMMFSPEMIAGQTRGRAVAIRAEDVFLMAIIFAWLIKISFTKDIVAAFRTRLTGPFFLYITVCVISTLFAIIAREEIDIRQSLFSILKYIEYFLLFIMVHDNLKSMKLAKFFVAVFLLTALFTTIHSNVFIERQLEQGARFFRAAPPVETRKGGESGTLGGYLVFMLALTGGLLVHARSTPARISLAVLEVGMFRAFLYTLSRGSYIAIVPALMALVYFTKKGRLVIIYVLTVASVLVAVFAPKMIRERVTKTIELRADVIGAQVQMKEKMGGAEMSPAKVSAHLRRKMKSADMATEVITRYMELEESPRARLESWMRVLFYKLPASPLFGHGVAKSFIDGQLFLTLCEVGLLGTVFFVYVFARLFKMAKDIMDAEPVKKDNFSIGLSVGFMSGFVGLLAHSFSANTFIVIRIMEPFWFVAAIVLSLPQLLEEEKFAKAAPETFK